MADLYTEARKRADETIDEQAILDKYNAATVAQFNAQREQNRINENNFYNQMYNTQRTAMDTIRQSNAAAVASGASRGVQAAQELSSLLGLQQESVASATELAQANRQTAQEETAAVLENVLNAYKEAEAQKQQAVTQEIQAASVEAEKAATKAQTNQQTAENLRNAAIQGTSYYLDELRKQGLDYSVATNEGATSLDLALNSLTATGSAEEPNTGQYFTKDDFASASGRVGSGKASEEAARKVQTLQTQVNDICATYGLDPAKYQEYITTIQGLTDPDSWSRSTGGVITNWIFAGIPSVIETLSKASKDELATTSQGIYNDMLKQMKADYRARINTEN